MCVEEYIAYQCGHRSLSVLRPCPSTTQIVNLPICTNHPVQQFHAVTMCQVCERLLHGRWVLIAEWEHRWYHERGACGCDVVFPSLLTRPRMIGGGPTAADGHTGAETGGSGRPFLLAAPAATPTPALPANPLWLTVPGPQAVAAPTGPAAMSASGRGSGVTSRAGAGTRNFSSGRANRRGRGRGATITTRPPGHITTFSAAPPALPTGPSGTSVPPIYSESVVEGQRHVAIRLPGLFAAEWVQDHRALHRTNPSHCRVNTNTVRPLSDTTQMNPEDRSLLSQCRAIDGMNPVLQGQQISAAVAMVGDIFPTSAATETALITGSGQYTRQPHDHAGASAITHTISAEVAVIAGGHNPLPVLGLPVGAGPEGIDANGSHMPPWTECRLRRGPLKRRNSI
ncbi:hypothetical protein QBC37DRAFT_384914 [Rhypophila decipiens]|uniref:Uncharacterized protein n=1 Tax=Rhypophila decipiens TaxID=261697 RepID=A0AAN6YEA2_9PEZI|nr:hypothetical protein QBC37DRAFT_384914 [Rhypophila decipiens]